jgi:hypothetical protein
LLVVRNLHDGVSPYPAVAARASAARPASSALTASSWPVRS